MEPRSLSGQSGGPRITNRLVSLGNRSASPPSSRDIGGFKRTREADLALAELVERQHGVAGRNGRSMAGVLTAGPEAVLGHRSAAAPWGIRRTAPDRIGITVPGPTRSSSRIRRHVTRLPEDERTERWDIPVTTAARTVWDLAATSPPEQMESDLRQLEYLRPHDLVSLVDLLDRYPGRRGARHPVPAR